MFLWSSAVYWIIHRKIFYLTRIEFYRHRILSILGLGCILSNHQLIAFLPLLSWYTRHRHTFSFLLFCLLFFIWRMLKTNKTHTFDPDTVLISTLNSIIVFILPNKNSYSKILFITYTRGKRINFIHNCRIITWSTIINDFKNNNIAYNIIDSCFS